MASLGNLLARAGRGIARIPRAVDDALTDEEVDPVTGKVIRRPSRIAQGLGEVIRAGVVAAGSPTPGSVGTAQDIFGGMKAVEQDRQVRQDRANNQRRQQVAEDMARQRNAREMRDSDADFALRQAQITKENALAAKATRQQEGDPEDIKRYKYAHKQAMDAGLGPEKAHAHGMAAMTRQTTGFLAPVQAAGASSGTKARNPMEYARELMQENDRFNTPAGAEDDPTGDREMLNSRIIDRAFGEKPTPGRVITTDQGVVVVDPKKGTSTSVKGPNGKALMPFVRPRKEGGGDGDGMTRSQRYNATVSTLIDRLQQEDSAGSLETTLRNVMQFYKDDPEVQKYRSAIIAELRRRMAASKPTRETNRTAARAGKSVTSQPYTKPKPAAAPGQYEEGDEVEYEGKRAIVKAVKPNGMLDLELIEE